MAKFRETVLIMARNNHTPVPYWLDMPLIEFNWWIKANNEINKNKDDE